MKISAKAPCRVDLAGGTLDIWPLYLFHPGSVTVNFAVDRFTSCEVRTRKDRKVILRSADQKIEEVFDSLGDLNRAAKYKLPLLAYTLSYFAPESGLELSTDSEAPAGAGISGSSALIITIASAMNRLLEARLPLEKIREISQNIEAQIIRVPTGCQDYYPAMYGGVSAIELTPGGIVHKTIHLDPESLNDRIVLAYTGVPRNSGINNWEVTKFHIDGDRGVYRNFSRIAAIARAMRGALERSGWAEVASLLRTEWANRKKNAPGISTPLIDQLISATRKVGAHGAKVCGAGGGGCVFFLVDPAKKEAVGRVIESLGAQVLPVRLALRGVQVQVSR